MTMKQLKKFIDHFRPSRHIMIKSWFATTFIVVASLLFISLGSQIFLRNYFLSHALTRAEITQPARRRHLKVHFLLSQRDLLIFAEQLNLRTSFHEYAAAKMKITLNLTVIFRIHFMICMYHIHLFVLP